MELLRDCPGVLKLGFHFITIQLNVFCDVPTSGVEHLIHKGSFVAAYPLHEVRQSARVAEDLQMCSYEGKLGKRVDMAQCCGGSNCVALALYAVYTCLLMSACVCLGVNVVCGSQPCIYVDRAGN